ncbi:hypothetical protein N7532_011339 [Penicillium argentinense]|uniref:Fatty acid hydroxylase domain-containing protein n=1 Tax=Penicillium argentinense TaxID=1131581 RepID=A0A9W9EI87_9EURO|nr:uncharacterized protein N7532_011339 [Penicillium argentinense]KAJ5082296.1 hypothetical protein N7532_011339 [Penicillium argentinense]
MLDALFSIPFLSLILVPVVSSYSTSLNLLFFYMTWTTLVLSHPPLRVELFGTAAVRILFFALPSLLFFLFDVLTPSAAVVIKAQGESGLPGGKRRRNIRLKEFKVAGWAFFNVCLGIAAQAAIETLLVRGLGWRSAIRVSMKLPMPWEMVKDMLRGLLGREILTYVLHRYILHHSRSSILASRHRSWFHSLDSPYPLTAHYDHPLAYLVGRFLPTYILAMFFRFHMLTYMMYLTFISLEETFVYSGYTVMPTTFFLGGIARRTEMHLITDGEGNFGPWGVLDWVCGTTVGDSNIEDDLVDELEEHEVDEKVRKALEASKRKIREGTLRRNTGAPRSSRRKIGNA